MDTHELARAFAALGLDLHADLCSMLNDEHIHHTERRGCGFTQATRVLAEQINQARLTPTPRGRVFATDNPSPALLGDWRAAVTLPESRILGAWIEGVLKRDAQGVGLHVAAEKLKVGSCPLAEQFFLEIAHGRIRRGGSVNVLVDADGRPRLLEKRGLGDEHSCISVDELIVNGVRTPRGSLFAIDYADDLLAQCPATSSGRGHIVALDRVSGRLLRLTTLAVAPEDRQRTFTAHYRQQIEGGLFSPDSTRIEQLCAFAGEQLP